MTIFVGTAGNDTANAALGQLSGFTGGTLAQLQDRYGDGIFGFEGEDVIYAGDGNDDIEGWDGRDIINGGDGNDQIWAMQISNVEGSLIGDEITGNDGNDRIFGSAGGDSIDGSADNDVLYGGGGDDLLQGGTGADTLSGGGGGDTIYATDLSEAVEEGQLNNTLEGDAGNDAIIGGSTRDYIAGGAGRDTVLGRGGDDWFYFLVGDLKPGDSIDGGSGIDLLVPWADVITPAPAVHDFRQVTVASVEALMIGYAGGASDTVRVLFRADQIDALAPDLALVSGEQSSTLVIEMGSANAVSLGRFDLQGGWGAKGDDHVEVIGDASAERITGTGGVDLLSGNSGNDRLDGSGGVDTITGGIGLDTLTGGAGADLFVYKGRADSTVATTGRDLIRDFSHAQADRIDLHLIDANAKAGGNQAFTFIGNKAFTKHAGELQTKVVGSNTLVSGDVNGDGKGDFAALVHGDAFHKGDFIL